VELLSRTPLVSVIAGVEIIQTLWRESKVTAGSA